MQAFATEVITRAALEGVYEVARLIPEDKKEN